VVAVGHQLEGRHAPFKVRKYAVKTYCRQLLHFSLVLLVYHIHAAVQFQLSTVTVSAESVNGSAPAVRVTWNTTVPPECVTSVRVEFRTGSQSGPVVANYTTTNTSQTEVIRTGLQCATYYYITVKVTGTDGKRPTLSSRPMEVLVGGKEIVCMRFNCMVCTAV